MKEQFFKMLGVAANENFYIITANGIPVLNSICFFTEDCYLSTPDGRINSSSYIPQLINGSYHIQRIPFIPQCNELYWFICVNGALQTRIFTSTALETINALNVAVGNCYRTQKEAEADKERMLQILKGKIKLKPVNERG